jgi:MFS family permease
MSKAKHHVQHEVEDNLEIARAEAPQFQRVSWTKEPHLRKLYLMSVFLLIASATTGYDGMLANTCQQMDLFKRYFSIENGKVNEVFIWDAEKKKWDVDENKLGIMINMFNIGSIISFLITPYLADKLGRKPTIMIGCVIMMLGGAISAFCNGYGSKYLSYTRARVPVRSANRTANSVDGWSLHPRFWQLARSDVLSSPAH